MKEQCDRPEAETNLLKEPWEPEVDELPAVVPWLGLSAEQQWYLYEYMQPFCPDNNKDTVCPLPSVPKPGLSRQGTPHPEDDRAANRHHPKVRLCGTCHQPGHDQRTSQTKSNLYGYISWEYIPQLFGSCFVITTPTLPLSALHVYSLLPSQVY